MDSWTEDEIKAMQVGGNQSLRSFFEEHGISNDATIREKYSSPAAALYREMYFYTCSLSYFQHQSEDSRRRTSDRAPCGLRSVLRRDPSRSPSLQIRRRRIGEPGRFFTLWMTPGIRFDPLDRSDRIEFFEFFELRFRFARKHDESARRVS